LFEIAPPGAPGIKEGQTYSGAKYILANHTGENARFHLVSPWQQHIHSGKVIEDSHAECLGAPEAGSGANTSAPSDEENKFRVLWRQEV
jgi:hypothetical protein